MHVRGSEKKATEECGRRIPRASTNRLNGPDWGDCRTMVRRRGVEKMRTRDGVSICVREYERVERGGLRLP